MRVNNSIMDEKLPGSKKVCQILGAAMARLEVRQLRKRHVFFFFFVSLFVIIVWGLSLCFLFVGKE